VRQRSISAVFVVLGGLVPALFGGPVWAIAVALFATAGLSEFHNLTRAIDVTPLRVGYVSIWLGCLASVAGWGRAALIGPIALAIGLAFAAALAHQNGPGSLMAWAMELAGATYLTIPAIAAIELRQLDGSVSADWVGHVSGWFSFGRRALIPAISPKKTVEGLIGGLVTGVLFGLLANELLGLDLPVLAAAGAALVLSVVGVVGDLAESLLKRQAGVKDSGSLIPGHGGMLDRIDALLFTWTAGWYIAILCDRIWS
jgi:phosphatidate cytidylyltransferase